MDETARHSLDHRGKGWVVQWRRSTTVNQPSAYLAEPLPLIKDTIDHRFHREPRPGHASRLHPPASVLCSCSFKPSPISPLDYTHIGETSGCNSKQPARPEATAAFCTYAFVVCVSTNLEDTELLKTSSGVQEPE